MFDSFIDILHQNSNNLDIEYVALRLFTAVILSSIIGCERANKRHSAGLRTFILSSFSTSIAMIMDLYLIQNTSVNMPILSALSILSISILSSKTILFSSRNQIKGLTTSVGLWTCGLIGLTSGAGLYLISIVSFAIFHL